MSMGITTYSPIAEVGAKKTHHRKIFVKETLLGQGVFARKSFPVDSIIGEVSGLVFDDPEYSTDYCMDLGEDLSLEPLPPFRYLNHSCDPNCELLAWKSRKIDGRRIERLWIAACRDIHEHEQLTLDYAWPAEAAIPCLCGADACRGWVVCEEDLPEILARKLTAVPDESDLRPASC